MTEPVATSPGADPQALLEQLKLLTANPGAYFRDDAQKREAQGLIKGAITAVEEPFETMQRLVYGSLPLVTARIGQDRSIFSQLAASDEAIRLTTLAESSGLPPGVLEPIMDYLCTQGMARETERGRYGSTPLGQMLLAPLFNDAVTHFHDNCLPAFSALHRVLADPAPDRTAFKLGQHSDVDFYTWMETHPVQQGAFHRFMEAQFAMLPTWLDVVQFESEVSANSTETDVVFVDVGGGNGSQCAALKKSYPNLKGRIILQDRPAVLEKALSVEGMENMAYDFLTEQPVKNARAYYFRQIMHNYDDATCVQILKSHLPALGPHSRIFIDDKTLPDEKPETGVEYTAALSLAMKAMFDAQERREAHWHSLLKEAGLKVVEIRKFTKFDDSVIIAQKI